MRVGNILPGDRIEVELRYTELLVAEERVYEFVFPTVVGPRYAATREDERGPAGPLRRDSLSCAKAPTPGPDSTSRWRSTRACRSRELSCTSHRTRSGGGRGRRRLSSPRSAGERRRQPRLHPALPPGRRAHRVRPPALRGSGRGLLPGDGPAAGAGGAVGRPAPRVHLRGGRVGLHERLPARHREGAAARPHRPRSSPPTPSTSCSSPATPTCSRRGRCRPSADNVARAIRVIDGQRGGGGTELHAALRPGPARPAQRDGFARSVVLVTDGYISAEADVFALIAANLGRDELLRLRHRHAA